MNCSKKPQRLFTRRYIWFAFAVPFGALLLVKNIAASGPDKAKPASDMKESVARTSKSSKPVTPGNIRESLKRLKTLIRKRAGIQKKEDRLLNRLAGLKEHADEEIISPANLLLRRELEKTAGDLHTLFEQDRKLAGEQSRIVQNLLRHKAQTYRFLNGEKGDIERQIRLAKKSGLPAKKIRRLENQLKEVENIRAGFELLDKNAGALFSPELRTSHNGKRPPETEAWHPGKYRSLRKGPGFEGKGRLEYPGAGITGRLIRLQKQLHFLRGQLERSERELMTLRDVVERIRERHPEFFEEIKAEFPPSPPAPGKLPPEQLPGDEGRILPPSQSPDVPPAPHRKPPHKSPPGSP